MFSYIDPAIHRRLVEQERLVQIDEQGRLVESAHQQPYLALLGPIPLPVIVAGKKLHFLWWAFVRRIELGLVSNAAAQAQGGESEAFRQLLQSNMSVNSVLATPNIAELEEPLVRVHSCCMTGDVFGSQRCECGPQLDSALLRIADEGGAVIYMSGHEGRGIGLWAKAVTYLLQDDGQDTYEANISLGLPEDSRDFTEAGVVLRYLLKNRPLRLLSNNPFKKEHLERVGQSVSQLVPLVTGIGPYNSRYMHAKMGKGHLITLDTATQVQLAEAPAVALDHTTLEPK